MKDLCHNKFPIIESIKLVLVDSNQWMYNTRRGRKSQIQLGNTDLNDRCMYWHTYYFIICKQNPFKIIIRGVQGCTSTPGGSLSTWLATHPRAQKA